MRLDIDTAGLRGWRVDIPDQRAHGHVEIAFATRGGRTVLADLRQSGCLKARFPRAARTEAVLLNMAGGVAGGDSLSVDVTLAARARASVTTAAAEKFYRALAGPSRVRNTVTLRAGADLAWLPQEAIVFDRCAMIRSLEVEMAEDARFTGIESLIFGRKASGETVRDGLVRDTLRITRGGRLILHDAVRLSGPIADLLARPAIGAGAAAVATLVHVAPDASARVEAARAALDGAPVEAGVSSWDGMLVARVLARDGACLRRGIVAGLAALRDAPLPRVWLC